MLVFAFFQGDTLTPHEGFVNRRFVKQSFSLRASNEHIPIVRVARAQE